MEFYGSIDSVSGSITASVFTGSFTGDGGGLYNIQASGVTGLNLSQIASGNATASISSTGFTVNKNTQIQGNLSVTGSIVATNYIVSSSVTYMTTSFASGSSAFGNDNNDVHQFTGSVAIAGTLSLNGSPIGTGKLDETTFQSYTSSLSSSIGSLSASIALTDVSQSNRLTTIEGNYATTGSNLFKGNQTISGSIIPSVSGSYDLGDVNHPFRHLYLSSASLYIDGTKVLGSTTQELQITTDNGQSFKILEAGTDTITLQSADGDIQLKTSGGGNVLLDPTTGIVDLRGTVQVQDGYKLRSSGGTQLVFGDDVDITGSLRLTGTIQGVNLLNFSSSVSASINSLSGGNTTLSSSVATTTSNLSSSIGSLSSSVATTTSGLTSTITSVSSSLTSSIGSLSSSLATTTNGLSSSIGSLSSSVATTTSNISSSIGSLSSSLVTANVGLSSSINSLSSSVVTTISNLSSSVATTTSNLSSSVATTTSGLSSSVATTTGNLSTTITNLSSSVSTSIGSLSSSVATTTSGISSTVTNLSSSVATTTSGISSTVTNLSSSVATTTSGISSTVSNLSSSVATTTGNLSTTITNLSSSVATTTLASKNRLDSIEPKTGSYATTGSNIFQGSQTITGSLYISQDLIVAGSSSIQHISSSIVNIADNIITVNTFAPSTRFGGIGVIDSGSSPQTSGSLIFDSVDNEWIFVHQQVGAGAITSSTVITGPETINNVGNETHLTDNRVPKLTSGFHIIDSNITDTGTLVSINSNTEVTGTLKVTSTITGTLSGNASTATSSSYATTATSSSYATTAGSANSATTATSSSYATTATSSSYASTAGSANSATTATTAATASYVSSANVSGTVANATSSSYATNATSSSYASTAGSANAVAWTNVSSRPTALSSFTNDLGNYGGWITSAANWFGASSTSGNLDWNASTNTKPGSGDTLLLGTATNGFSVNAYYHSFNLEYSSKDGSGNVTQFAVSYGTPGDDLRMRGRYGGTWSSWVRFLNTSNYSTYASPLAGSTSITTVGTITGGTWNGTAIANSYLANSSFYVGTTSISLGRGSASQTLAGVSIDGNAATVTGGVYTSGDQTIAGIKTFSNRIVFNSAVTNRPQFPGGIVGLDTGDGNFDIWGISRDYYPSHATSASAWGLRWNGDNNDFEFVGGGTSRVILDMDGGNITNTGNISATGTISASNFSGSHSGSSSGTNTGDQTNISGNAATATLASNSSGLNGLSKSQLWNNSGQNHGAYTSFSGPTDFGEYFVHQDSSVTDGPSGLSYQYYVKNVGLGNDYAYSSYAMQTAVNRYGYGTTFYTWVRFKESGTWQSWNKMAAGYADTAGNITAYTINQNLGTGNNVSFARVTTTDGTNSISIGQWDGSTNRIESASRALFLTSYSAGLYFGMSGSVNYVMNGSALYPNANNTYSLGTATYGWSNIYTNDLHLSNMNKEGGNDIDGTNGTWTIQEGAENLYIINNNNGKKYKIDLTEIK